MTKASSSTPTIDEAGARRAEDVFFASLRAADVARLADVLTDDFVLVDVMRGGVVSRSMLLDALASGQLHFDGIDVLESHARHYDSAAVIVGRTKMHGRAGNDAWTAASRYTHVYVHDSGRWRLASAQGTPIIDS